MYAVIRRGGKQFTRVKSGEGQLERSHASRPEVGATVGHSDRGHDAGEGDGVKVRRAPSWRGGGRHPSRRPGGAGPGEERSASKNCAEGASITPRTQGPTPGTFNESAASTECGGSHPSRRQKRTGTTEKPGRQSRKRRELQRQRRPSAVSRPTAIDLSANRRADYPGSGGPPSCNPGCQPPARLGRGTHTLYGAFRRHRGRVRVQELPTPRNRRDRPA